MMSVRGENEYLQDMKYNTRSLELNSYDSVPR